MEIPEFISIQVSVTVMLDVFETGITMPVEVGTMVQIGFGLGIQIEIQMVQIIDTKNIETMYGEASSVLLLLLFQKIFHRTNNPTKI
ncbi:hypothetical protein KBD33_04145 [Candidatus Gracilibacteria bacterium]|nr:hypothetical protein [Candidatus Gracilibacteria bacterium]